LWLAVTAKEAIMLVNNLVAKHAKTFNKAHVMVDRKKASKRGAVKHKGRAFAHA
jgi:sialic acid synthase SpsE